VEATTGSLSIVSFKLLFPLDLFLMTPFSMLPRLANYLTQKPVSLEQA
jgi:hypothetical protein